MGNARKEIQLIEGGIFPTFLHISKQKPPIMSNTELLTNRLSVESSGKKTPANPKPKTLRKKPKLTKQCKKTSKISFFYIVFFLLLLFWSSRAFLVVIYFKFA